MEVIVTDTLNTGYYESITNTTDGETLYNQLYTLLGQDNNDKGSENPSYGDAREYLIQSDVDIEKTDKLRGMYKDEYFNKIWDEGDTWTREHVWPQSYLDSEASGNSNRNSASDAHNLRACGTSTNTSRSNKYFTTGTGFYGDASGSGYFPGDRDKGDVARILLYMDVRYSKLTLVNGAPAKDQPEFGDLSVLLQWHRDDKVDEFEIQRNEVIYNVQGNRNPFIDNPEWFEIIWNFVSSRARARQKALDIYDVTISQLSTNMTNYVELSDYSYSKEEYVC